MSNPVVAAILALPALIPNLTQLATNGLSNYGTLNFGALPQFLTNNPLPNGFPWSTNTVSNTNPYEFHPTTGVTRFYDFTISRGYIAPDGVNKSVLLINGQFPGPLIQANWGDQIQVTVHNRIEGPEEGTALHWHGILQKGHPWEDGVPAVSQCPIAPTKDFTYSFTADLYGTSWYHSHYSGQYAGGLVGPMIIYGPTNAFYDIDVGPVLLTDYYHTEYFQIVEQVMSSPPSPPPLSDNNLINGKMNFDCALTGPNCTSNAGLSKFKFRTGKTHRLRLINAGAEGIQRFSIDNHTMVVIANDFVPVIPYQTDVVTLGIGQRTDVLVTATGQANGAYWMRSDISSACSNTNQPHALAAIYYPLANTSTIPKTTSHTIDDSVCGNDPLEKSVPFFPITPPPKPATTQEIDVSFVINATGHFLWTMNKSPFRGNYNSPVLLLSNTGNNSYPDDPEWNVYNFGSNSSVRLIVRNYFPVAHPMHLHGHNFFVLHEGQGDWDGVTVNHASNPQRRDVQIMQPGNAANPSHMVIEFNQDNPGVWPFHCHIAWHVSAGLYINVIERPADIKKLDIPSSAAQVCRDWWKFSGAEPVLQIDSGL